MTDDVYRKAAKGRSPALEALAAQARAEVTAPVPTKLLRYDAIQRRLAYAVDLPHTPKTRGIVGVAGGLVGSCTFWAAINGGWPIVGLLSGILGAGGWYVAAAASAARSHDRAVASAVQELLAWESSHPFPTTGLVEFLVADRSTVRIRLAAPLEAATFIDAVKVIDPTMAARASVERTFELVVASRRVGQEPFGDIGALKRIFSRLLRPLHDDVGIEQVELGGIVAPPAAPRR